MKKFTFKFDPLLKLRKNQRDQCQQLLTNVLRHDDELLRRRSETERDRSIQIDELRSLSGGGDVNVGASASRRLYAGHLSGNIGHIEAERATLRRQIDLCRQALIRADQAVKSLDKLAEKQLSEFVFAQQSVESRELEQTWQAVHAGELQRS